MEIRKANTRKELVQLIMGLAWPTILEEFLQTVVVYADTAMVGQIGANATAAVGLNTPVTWLINAPAYSLGVGILAYISRNNGAGKKKEVKVAGIQSVYLCFLLGLVTSLVVMGISPFLPKWMGGEEAVLHDASMYLFIIGASFIFKSVDMILSCAIRGTGDTKTPMTVNAMVNVINVVANFFLIYDCRYINIFGIKVYMIGADLGVTGAALGTAISSVFGGIAMLFALYRSSALSPRGISKRVNGNVMYQCAKVGIPLALQRLLVFSGYAVFTAEVAFLGTVTLAAHSIAITAEEMFYIPGFGMQDAGATLIGNAMGEGDDKKTDRLARMLILVTAGIMTITGLALFLMPGFMMSLFTRDAAVIGMGLIVLRMVAVSEPVYGALIMMEGIFNGVGNTKTTFIVGVSTMWIVRIGLTFVVTRFFGGGLIAVWSCMILENVVKASILGFLFLKGYWKKGAVTYS